MSTFLALSYLFFIGSTIGWLIELIYRRFFSKTNEEKKWINPGLCIGPYLPLYGIGLCILYLISLLSQNLNIPIVLNKIITIIMIGFFMTLIEFITGYYALKKSNVRFWDYSNEWGNIKGIICPKFSLYWTILGAIYYFLIHPKILGAIDWLTENLSFSYVIGFFFGVFTIDFIYSTHMISKITEFANEHGIIVKYEKLKADIRESQEKRREKIRFFLSLKTNKSLKKTLADFIDKFEKRK